jgi:hypothetical protein
MTATENPLSRWSRLKRDVVSKGRAGADQKDTPARSAGPANTQPEAGLDEGFFDPQDLPSIDAITLDTDIRAFLKSRVPAELTCAALRRAWTSDPAIRDFIGIAENQWDFNDPTAMSGFGPLPASDNVPALLARAIGASDKGGGTIAEISLSLAQPPATTTDREYAADDQSAPQALDEGRSAEAGISGADAPTARARATEANHEANDPSPIRRHHGGALPR